MTDPRAASPVPAMVEVWVRRVSDVPDGRDLLDGHERQAWSRIIAPQAAMAYAAGHALARRAVADVVGSAARGLRFDRTCPACGQQHGPPRPRDFPGISVSLSHVDSHVAVAVSRGLAVGVDVDHVGATDFAGFSAVAEHPDQPAGHDRGVQEPGTGAHARAVTWVRKEAALKSLGIGLRVDPAGLLTPPSGPPTDLLGDGSWVTVRDVALPWPDVVAAVAVAGRADPLVVQPR